MINNVEQYLAELKRELAGSDRATMQDALADAEEYLRTALDSALKEKPHVSATDLLTAIIDKYGQPKEIAVAYKEIESRTVSSFARPVFKEARSPSPPAAVVPPSPPPLPAAPAVPDTRNIFAKFFGVFAQAKTWGAFFYLMMAMFLGIAYFTWAVTGLSVSVGLLVLVVGVPIFFLFLLSVRGIALLEGRLIEALLGIRMPRRPLFTRKDISWWDKMKNLFSERHTWTAMIYMLFQMPLGIIYFSVFVALMATSLGLVFKPISELVFNVPSFVIGDFGYFTPGWLLPFTVIGGILLATATMHLVKYAGKAHAAWAKIMLVRE
jgi:hypothetical protein